MVKNPPANAGDSGSILGPGRSPGEGNGTPVFLPGKSHGQMSLVGYSPWGHKRVRHNLVTEKQYVYTHICICIYANYKLYIHIHMHAHIYLCYTSILWINIYSEILPL